MTLLVIISFFFLMQFTGDLKTYDAPNFLRQGFGGLKSHDLKWVVDGPTAKTSLKVGKYTSVTAYSTDGMTTSTGTKKVNLIRLQQYEDMVDPSSLTDACRWITERTIEFWDLTKDHIYGMFLIDGVNRDAVRIIIGSGLTELEQDEPPFTKKCTFFTGKFTKYAQFDEKKQKTLPVEGYKMSNLKNSFFMASLSIKTFTVRFNAPSNEIIIRTFVNVNQLTYLNQTLPEVTPTENQLQDQEEEVAKTILSLKELISKKKRKADTK